MGQSFSSPLKSLRTDSICTTVDAPARLGRVCAQLSDKEKRRIETSRWVNLSGFIKASTVRSHISLLVVCRLKHEVVQGISSESTPLLVQKTDTDGEWEWKQRHSRPTPLKPW